MADFVLAKNIQTNILLQTYKCTYCTYETIHRNYIKVHILGHRKPEEVEMHKCPHCKYESKHKRGLQNHMKSHLNIADLKPEEFYR